MMRDQTIDSGEVHAALPFRRGHRGRWGRLGLDIHGTTPHPHRRTDARSVTLNLGMVIKPGSWFQRDGGSDCHAFRSSRSFLPVIPTLTRVPGAAQHEAKRNGALQTRDRYGPRRTPAVMVRRMAQDYVSSYRIPMSARSGASETTPRARVR